MPSALFEDPKARWREAVAKVIAAKDELDPSFREAAERMAMALLPPDEVKASEYGYAALEESNALSKDMAALTMAASESHYDEYLHKASEKVAAPASGGLFGFGKTHQADIEAIEERLRVMEGETRDFRAAVADFRSKVAESLKRVILHIAALEAAIGCMGDHPAKRVAEMRLDLLTKASSLASLSPKQQEAIEAQVDSWIRAVTHLLYTGVPAWYQMNSNVAFKNRKQ